MATDSPDVLVLREPCQSIDVLERLGADLVYIGDSSFWPAEFQDVKVQEEQVPGARDTRFRYLNSGTLVGRTDFCRDFFTQAVREAETQIGVPYVEGTSGAGTDSDDQSIMKRLYPANYPRVQLDFRCEFPDPHLPGQQSALLLGVSSCSEYAPNACSLGSTT